MGPIPIPSANTPMPTASFVPASFTTATAPAAAYGTIAFAPITTNPTPNVSHNFVSTHSATVNNVATPLAGFKAYARSGFVDTNGVVLGQCFDNRMNTIYTVNDTAYYPTVTCTGSLCPPGAQPYTSNANYGYLVAGASIASCGGTTAQAVGCATAGPSAMPDISNVPDHARCAWYTSLVPSIVPTCYCWCRAGI